jgi:ubiquitin-like 1-activating enzyme E1 B
LFGEDENGGDELDAAEKAGENGKTLVLVWQDYLHDFLVAQEIENLRKEAQAFRAVRKALRLEQASNGVRANGIDQSNPNGIDPARLCFEKASLDQPTFTSVYVLTFIQIFTSDIKNLLSMADMWKHRPPPTPLDFDSIAEGTFTIPSTAANGSANPSSSAKLANGHTTAPAPSSSSSKLKDQKELTLQESLVLFISRYARCPSSHACRFNYFVS